MQPEHVGIEVAPEIALGELIPRGAPRRAVRPHARRVDTTELFLCLSNELGPGAGGPQCRRDRRAARALGPHRLDRHLGGVLIASIVDHDGQAGFRQTFGDGSPDAAAATGHYCYTFAWVHWCVHLVHRRGDANLCLTVHHVVPLLVGSGHIQHHNHRAPLPRYAPPAQRSSLHRRRRQVS